MRTRKKASITIYMSISSVLIVSLMLVVLESARVFMTGTALERYGHMAGEMTLSNYTWPVAEQYDLLVLNRELTGENFELYQSYFQKNMEYQMKMPFSMTGILNSVNCTGLIPVQKNQWTNLKEQMVMIEKMQTGGDAIQIVRQWMSQLNQNQSLRQDEMYLDELMNEGRKTEVFQETEQAAEEPEIYIKDPRPGVKRLIGQGLKALVLKQEVLSNLSINQEDCSWKTDKTNNRSIDIDFENYQSIIDHRGLKHSLISIRQLGNQSLETLLCNRYIGRYFSHYLKQPEKTDKNTLQYEIEYLLSGDAKDSYNMEAVLSQLYMFRLVFNLASLYSSPGKSQMLANMAQNMLIVMMFPFLGKVIHLLLMICLAASESILDCRTILTGGKVPLIKGEQSWQLTLNNWQNVIDGSFQTEGTEKTNGLDYGAYLQLLLLMVPEDIKMVRMTQIIEKNCRLYNTYEAFYFKNCMTAFSLEVQVEILPCFWTHPKTICHKFSTEHQYEFKER